MCICSTTREGNYVHQCMLKVMTTHNEVTMVTRDLEKFMEKADVNHQDQQRTEEGATVRT